MPTATATRYTLDRQAALNALPNDAEDFIEGGDDDIVSFMLGHEAPARAIEQLVYDFDQAITPPDGFSRYDLQLYPLIYESDPDGILIVATLPTGVRLASDPMDWDDIAPRELRSRSATTDEIIGIIEEVIRRANELLDKYEMQR